MRGLVIRWVLYALAILLVAVVYPGLKVDSVGSAFIAALLLGVLNAVVRPVIKLFTLPINILTLGLFSLVINGFMLIIVANTVKGIQVTSVFAAIIAALLLSIFSAILNGLVRD